MSFRPKKRLYGGLLCLAVFIILGVSIWWWMIEDSSPPKLPSQTSSLALPRLSSSDYLNTKSAAEYVGSDACADCHQDEFAAFAATPHYQALQRSPLENEPPNGEFQHAKSGRTYRVYRKNGQMWHQEVIQHGLDQELILGDYPVAFRIGSGHFSRSYLMEIDGFLIESPITWYASQKHWALSPGYDFPKHDGFTRPAHEGCVRCHSGRVESFQGSTHRLQFQEQQIGCESCHGPGSLHVEHRTQSMAIAEEADLTIVHPRKLSRKLNEAICARCHMTGAASANLRGRDLDDFRPSLPLTDFRISYTTSAQDSQSMTVVGHFEQMQKSACYLKSETLTCTTCHNPHKRPELSERVAYYRQKCLSCHAGSSGGCHLPETERLAQNPANDCTACHMPKSGTNISHFAFTHHRIGVSHQTAYQEQSASTDLVPMEDISHLSFLDQQRCLGLALLHYAEKQTGPPREVLLQKAFLHLRRVYDEGLEDAPVVAGLAYLYWTQGSGEALEFAQRAIATPHCNPESRVNALIILGDMNLQADNIPEARQAFEQLTKIRLRAVDWHMLGVCQFRSGEVDASIAALRKAISLQRDQPEYHESLAIAYEKAGQPELAKQAQKMATTLRQLGR